MSQQKIASLLCDRNASPCLICACAARNVCLCLVPYFAVERNLCGSDVPIVERSTTFSARPWLDGSLRATPSVPAAIVRLEQISELLRVKL